MTETNLTPELKIALEQYKKRCKKNEGKQIDNSRLPAGSAMYYYCRFCGDHTETLPEGHVSRPKTICNPCKHLNDLGLIS